ncbi:hypothetical protein EK904_009180 [Melospiza melodia maxima]|nr:hypothetical protein EK904_009180 [Melospiza melodia maxima]
MSQEEDYSEEESSKVELKQDSNDSCESAARGEKGSEKVDAKGAVTGERQSGDGQESTEPVEKKVGKKVPKHLDDDEDRKNPAYIPRKGLFFEHDLRGQTQEEEVRPKGRQRKLWKDEGRWEHDKFREDEQAPKTRQELIALYGYDIRSAHNPDDIKPRRMRKPRNGEQAKQEGGYRGKHAEQSPSRDTSPELEVGHVHGSPGKEEGALENQATGADAVQPPPDRPVEKKSYSRARRTRVKAGEAGKLAEEVPASEGLAPVIPKATPAESSPTAAKSNWESPVESSVDGLEQEMTQMNLTEQNWSPGQSQFIPPRELRGIPNHVHVGAGPAPQFNRMEEMGACPICEPWSLCVLWKPSGQAGLCVPGCRGMKFHRAFPHSLSCVVAVQFQGPIYAHGENPAPLPPQGMIVQPEMHLPHPGEEPVGHPWTWATENSALPQPPSQRGIHFP